MAVIKRGTQKPMNANNVEVVTTPLTIKQSDNANHNYSKQYAYKYRNGFSLSNGINTNPTNVYYDIRCTNCNQVFYLQKTNKYVCPNCKKIEFLEENNEAQVVSMTIYVPVTEELQNMAKLIQLLTFHKIDDTTLLASMDNIQKRVDGQYCFVKTYYGVAEPYYYIENAVGEK